MRYVRCLFLNIFTIFFIDRLAPGLAVAYEGAVNTGAALLFALALGVLNATVYPFFHWMDWYPTRLQLGLVTGAISYGGFAFLAAVPVGIEMSAPGAAVGGTLVWIVSYLTNYWELRHHIDEMKK